MSIDRGYSAPDQRSRSGHAARRRRVRAWIVAGIFLGFVALAWAWAFQRGPGRTAGSDIPVLAADNQPTREKPSDPGGLKVADIDPLAFDSGRSPPKVENILPEPEKPLPQPQPAPKTIAAVPPNATDASPDGTAAGQDQVADAAVGQPVKLVPDDQQPPTSKPAAAMVAAPPPPVAKPPLRAMPKTKPSAVIREEPKPKPPKAKPVEAKPRSVEARPAEPKARPMEAVAPGSYRLQLASLKSDGDAHAMEAKLKGSYGDVLGGVGFTIAQVHLGDRGTFYRVMAGPMSQASASRICNTLRSRGAACLLPSKAPLAAILGCAGERLSEAERAFFADANPLGFILFKRNCRDPDQVAALIRALRQAVGRDDAPLLIDQEGGRVQRLGPPNWPSYPAPGAIGALPDEAAEQAAFIAAHLIADDLVRLGFTVDCFPLLDVVHPGADRVISDRAWGSEPDRVAQMGRAACDGLLQGQEIPVIKHMPGHGRAQVDSHHRLPRVTAAREELERTDFAPFRALRDAPWGMTAHVVYEAIDPDRPATLSARVITTAIRGSIGFEGVLVSDDLSMNALSGGIGMRAEAALAAGCDLALHCNGKMEEMTEVAKAVRPLSDAALRRLAAGEAQRRPPAPFDRGRAEARLRELMAAS